MADQQLALLSLYDKASDLAHKLRNYCENTQPKLPVMSEDELLECVTQYAEKLHILKELNDQIGDLTGQYLCAEKNLPKYESLRLAIRGDLTAVSAFEDICRSAILQKQKELRVSLMETQKRRRLSAYLQSSMMEQEQIHFERRD